MNKTVTIKEGNLTRRLAPIDKLKVNTTDNKDSMWVSTENGNTGVLHASENGIYIASEDGYEAYSEVIVRVTKDSFEGDTSFDDWDYETPDMDLSNWDPETVEEFENDPEGFDDIFNNEDEWKDIDKPIDIKMDNPKIQDTKISGIDPVTGNEMEVGLDENGYLTESTLPSSIKIEVPPSKLQYMNGQSIQFDGMIVKAYTADGELWTDDSHPDGVIPHSELTFPVTIASLDGSESSYNQATLDGVGTINYNIVSMFTYPPIEGVTATSAEIIPTSPVIAFMLNNHQKMAFSESYFEVEYYFEQNGYRWLAITQNPQATSTFSHKGVFFVPSIIINPNEEPYATPKLQINDFNLEDLTYQEIASILFDGTTTEKKSGEMSVPVQYFRSDGEVLEDSFTIEVLPDPDGAHPQVDPSTVEWNHRKYKANEDLGAVEVRHGSVYMEGGAIYDVGAAVKLGMLEPVDNEIVP